MKHASYNWGPFLILTFKDGSWSLYVGPKRSRRGFWFEIGFDKWLPISFEWRLGRPTDRPWEWTRKGYEYEPPPPPEGWTQ